MRLERALAAVTALGDIFEGGAVMNRAGGFQLLAARTDIEIPLAVVGKLSPAVDAVRRHFGSIPHRDVRYDIAVDQIAQ